MNVSIDLQNPITLPANGQSLEKSGDKFVVDSSNESHPFDWHNAYFELDSQITNNRVYVTGASRETVRDSLLTHQDIGLAVYGLSESTVKKEAKEESERQILNRLKLSMKPHIVHFDPVIPIKVQIKG
ncbi:unnamed protein product [Pocillopora meandrina]|uniref:Uncharacterized protein n=1 Tax=Pocillopora meandrina TaxID=46732 RepID=A0AAU9XB45_9CNID|nr:unnamed protein product [Pocillopora meandrina]